MEPSIINKNKKFKTKLPIYVLDIGRILQKEGYESFLVGGSVRDLIMGIVPDDYDIATNAKPEALLNIFPKAIATGIKFGTILVLSKDEFDEKIGIEVTTYRSEEDYIDGRWPSKVEFVDDINRDLGRRDFTMNSMAIALHDLDYEEIDTKKEIEFEITDLFGGIDDIDKKIVKAVGTPYERFMEDGLRSFRACRLASQLQFEIEKDTFSAMKELRHISAKVSVERIRDEFMKLLMNSPKPSKGIEYLRKSGLLELFLPELLEGVGVEQPRFHKDDVYSHALASVDKAVDSVKLAALFHDIGKPRCADGQGHFYGHDKESAKMVKEIMTRMRFSNADIEQTVNLVSNHMFYYPYYGEEGREKEKAGYWTDAAIRRFIKRVGYENLDNLFKLRIADAEGNPKSSWDAREIEALEKRISEVMAEDVALKISDLDITGHDLRELGIKPGPEMGKILKDLLEKVLDDPSLNKKESLIQIVQKDYLA